MTARTAAALSSAALVLVVSGCTSFYEIPIETPIQPKMDVTPFQRVFIAGFIAGGSEDVDANLETVRLLRSQLRSKSPLRVIEADVLPLVDLAREQAAPEGGAVPSLPPQGPPRRLQRPPVNVRPPGARIAPYPPNRPRVEPQVNPHRLQAAQLVAAQHLLPVPLRVAPPLALRPSAPRARPAPVRIGPRPIRSRPGASATRRISSRSRASSPTSTTGRSSERSTRTRSS